MSLQVVSIAQLAAQAETLIAIDLAAKDPAGRYAAAQVALQVAGAFTALSKGDAVGAVTEAVQAILTKVTDPGQVALVNSLAAVGMSFIQVQAQAAALIPLLSSTWQGIATAIAAGMTATASAYKPPTP